MHANSMQGAELTPNTSDGLLDAIAELFLHSDEPRLDANIGAFTDVMLRLMGTASVDERAEFSGRIAPHARTPHPVALRLAGDEEIRIAGPVLQHSPVLQDPDLIDIAQSRGEKHVVAMCLRRAISTDLSDNLIAHGATEARRVLSRNHGAKFSANGYAQLLEYAKGDIAIGAGLVERPDLALDMAKKLAKIIEESASKTPASGDVEHGEGTPQTLSKVAGVASLCKKIRSDQLDINVCLEQFCNDKNLSGIAQLLSALIQLPSKNIHSVFFSTNLEPILLICKSLEINDEVFGKIVGLWSAQLKLSSVKTSHATQHYNELKSKDARRALGHVLAKINAS